MVQKTNLRTACSLNHEAQLIGSDMFNQLKHRFVSFFMITVLNAYFVLSKIIQII